MITKIVTVYGNVRETKTGNPTATIPAGQTFQMVSLDGSTWFINEAMAIAFQNRVIDTPQLTAKQKEWLDLVELPTSHCDMRASLRMNA